MNAIARRSFFKPAPLIRAAVLCLACLTGLSPVSALELTPLAGAAATSSVTPPNPRDTLARQLADPDFDTTLREQLVSAARYPALPDPNRPAPRGKTTVTFEITPDGRVADAAITESSNSRHLDRAALAIVQRAGRGLHTGTPTEGSSRRYLVTFDFRLGAAP